MGVQEYLTFDPRPRKRLALKGYRLVQPGIYMPIPPDPAGGLWLETIQLRVVAEPGSSRPKRSPLLRFYTADGTPVLHRNETEAQLQAEQAARQAAEHQRKEAERHRRTAVRQRKEAEHQREEAERQRAEAEHRAAAERAERIEAERREAMERAERIEAERREAMERAARLEVERKLAQFEARLARLSGDNAPPPEGN
jgi:hypothetical protein